MTLKFNKIMAAIFAAIFVVSAAFGIYFLMPNSTAFAEESGANEHTEHDETTWTELTAALVNSADTKTAGEIVGSTEEGETAYYYLNNDVTLTDYNITITGNVVLCLNGKVLTGNGNGTVITISSGASLTLCDCNTTTEHDYYVDSNKYVFAECETECSDHSEHGTIYGGVITGGNANDGGGVYVSDTATFVMEGGAIAGNYANYGGGVYVYGSGTFTMSGGTITGNYAGNDGGGVEVYNGATLIMNDGEITDNTATHGGGLIVIANSEFEMYGGTIFGNSANYGSAMRVWSSSTATMYGGYVDGRFSTYNSTVTIYGGAFTSNPGNLATGSEAVSTDDETWAYVVAPEEGTTVVTTDPTCTTDGYTTYTYEIGGKPYTITVNVAATGHSYIDGECTVCGAVCEHDYVDYICTVCRIISSEVATHAHDEVTFTHGVASTGGTLQGGDDEEDMVYYYLLSDVTLTQNITISGYVTLCLNGHVLTGNGEGSVITIAEGASLTLCDCIGDGEDEQYAHNYYVNSDGLYVFAECATDCEEEGHEDHGTIYGGVITGGSANAAGGVYVYYGTFTMNGGTISGNTASYGGGVYVYYSTFTMNGGTISGNTASSYGGGVYVSGSTTFVMEGGAISGNTANSYGGGVEVYGSSATFTMNGGTISGNTASYGGGVDVYSASFTMNGGTISGNSASNGGGVYVYGYNGTATFTMNGGTISGNKAANRGINVMTYNSGASFIMNGGTIDGTDTEVTETAITAESASTLDITTTATINGGTINGTLRTTANTIYINGGTLNGIIFNYGSTAVTITGGYINGSIIIYASGTITIYGGALSEEAYESILDEDTSEPQYIAEGSEAVPTGDETWAYVVVPEGTSAVTTDPTCTTEGYTTYTYYIDEQEYALTVNIVEATGHSFTNYVSDNNATCTADGTKTATCDNGCGTTDTMTDEGSAKGHTLTHVEENAATKTEDGNAEYWYCSVCGKYFSDSAAENETTLDEVTIPATGGLSGGAIAGIVIACVVVAGAAVGLAIFLIRRRKNA